MIDAKEQKNYSNVAARIADAQIVVTDKKMKFNDTAIKVSKIVGKAKRISAKDTTQDAASWNEYRFYTSGILTKILLEIVLSLESKMRMENRLFIRSVTNKRRICKNT